MIVLTGATGGVGRAVATALAERGAHLVLTARDGEALEAVATMVRERGGRAVAHPCDLRDQQAVAELAERILAEDGVPEAVLNLAGHCVHRDLEATFGRPHDLVRLTGTNLLGPAALILALLAPMCAAGRGRIVAVTSASTRIPAPGWAAYGASKAGLDSWLRAIRPQAEAQGVGVAIVELPLVATSMATPTYGSSPRGALEPSQAAARVLRALDSRRTLVSPPWSRLGAVLSQAAPALTARAAGAGSRVAQRLSRRETGSGSGSLR
ncbi:SDR family NAD(P)-dependent oxidoreductase [Brachybacterium sacelli]|uniref:Short-subunit dehydrogenase n=2 Tax=Brachybacterium sacelli TaxID=173364 RepID=A0ABS4X2C9_9MICO|nr:SDR family NAD(P)-dependent oxidoreductase [Brachybacterium sacelli]MBP2382388.1 short-subunit dehydrogenase [Brachybacterium sacelli]